MAKPIVIVLSGSSSSGKTRLARALQGRLSFPVLHIEADRAFPLLPNSSFKTTINRDSLILAFHRSIAAWAASGFNLIVDGSLPYGNPILAAACLELFSQFDLRLAGVHCAIPVLEQRERNRGDRPLGWAVSQSHDINQGLHLDVDIDTSIGEPIKHADMVIASLGLN